MQDDERRRSGRKIEALRDILADVHIQPTATQPLQGGGPWWSVIGPFQVGIQTRTLVLESVQGSPWIPGEFFRPNTTGKSERGFWSLQFAFWDAERLVRSGVADPGLSKLPASRPEGYSRFGNGQSIVGEGPDREPIS